MVPKPFTMTVSPSTTIAQERASSSPLTIKNWSVQKLGSADITVPAALAITGATTTRGTVSVVGQTVKLRNLNLCAGCTRSR